MNAEQHFTLAPKYSEERAPRKNSDGGEPVRQFSLGFSFDGLESLISRFGREAGMFQAVLGVMLNIWALRQEMLGEMDTRELITLVYQGAGSLKFQNDLYGQAQDLEAMYLTGVNSVPDAALKSRYLSEARQAIHIFQTLTETLTLIDFSLSPELLKKQLKLNGFHEEEIDISPSMLANVGSLRRRIGSIDELEELIEVRPKVTAWVGPAQLLTVSPPHWSHHRGETGFVWMSESVVLPETKEAFIRQSGKFAKARTQDLLPYLSFFEKSGREFANETELMEFVSVVVSTDYRQPKAILDFLVGQLNRSGTLKRVGKIDPQIQSGDLDIRPYFDAVRELFEFEYARGLNKANPGVQDRLNNLSDKIKHQIARNQPQALPGLVAIYRDMLMREPALPLTQFTRLINSHSLKLDPGFSLAIDFSLLDCVAGTPFSLLNPGSFTSLRAGLGTEGFSALKFLEHHSVADRAAFERLARSLGKDPTKFPEANWGLCTNPNCPATQAGHKNYLGPCGWCLACEKKDDLGLSGDLGSLFDPNDWENCDASQTFRPEPPQGGRRPLGIGEFVNSCTGVAYY